MLEEKAATARYEARNSSNLWDQSSLTACYHVWKTMGETGVSIDTTVSSTAALATTVLPRCGTDEGSWLPRIVLCLSVDLARGRRSRISILAIWYPKFPRESVLISSKERNVSCGTNSHQRLVSLP